jgi:hypothetical protein
MSNIILISTSPNNHQDLTVERTIKVVQKFSSTSPTSCCSTQKYPSVRLQDIVFHLPSPNTSTESSSGNQSPILTTNSPLKEIHLVSSPSNIHTLIVPKCLIRHNHQYCITWNTRMGADNTEFSFHASDFDSDDTLTDVSDDASVGSGVDHDMGDIADVDVSSTVLNDELKFYIPDDQARTNFSQRLLQENLENMVISSEEEGLIQNSSVNTGKYEKQKSSVEDRYFQTIKDYGGQSMADLLVVVRHGLCIDRKFYFLVRGDRDETKRVIISKCLLLCALKWRNLKPGVNHGKFLRPKIMAQYLKMLFVTF